MQEAMGTDRVPGLKLRHSGGEYVALESVPCETHPLVRQLRITN